MTTVLAYLAIAVLSFVGGCFIGGALEERNTMAVKAEFSEAKERTAKEHATELQIARGNERAWIANYNDAERKANDLRNQKDAAVRSADDAARRLRDEGNRITVALNRLSAASAIADIGIARAATDALGECGGRLAAVAEQFDQCEIERRTLIGAWPHRE